LATFWTADKVLKCCLCGGDREEAEVVITETVGHKVEAVATIG
jgi:hypothetical protein